MSSPEQMVNVRYMVDDVQAAIDFYTSDLGSTVRFSAVPAFADATRGNQRLLLADPASSAGRPMPDGRRPAPGGWNRIHNDIVAGPSGKQILIEDPARNVVELFEPASGSASRP